MLWEAAQSQGEEIFEETRGMGTKTYHRRFRVGDRGFGVGV